MPVVNYAELTNYIHSLTGHSSVGLKQRQSAGANILLFSSRMPTFGEDLGQFSVEASKSTMFSQILNFLAYLASFPMGEHY